MGSFRIGEGYAPADPALVAVLEQTAARSPYDVVMFSGDRDGGGASQHDSARAVDIVLIDPRTGQEIPNLGAGGDSFGIYEQFAHTARAVQQEVAPQLNDTFRWGGYFSPSRLNPTGADLMHFDLGPTANMALGSWDTGLNQQGREFVAGLGGGRIYSEGGRRTTAPAGASYTNLWNTGGAVPAAGSPPMAYAGSPAPLTGAAAAASGMAEGLPTIRNGAGDRGNPDQNVLALQRFLNANGANVAVDGVFGDMTERAVRAYQEANGLAVDGVVGPETWGNIAGRTVAADPAAAGSLPGPVRGFVQRLFGDGAAGNLAQRVDAFRNGIRKGLSPVDAFTQARGQPINAEPIPGSPTAALPPKTAPVPPANPARAPIAPATSAGVGAAAPAAPRPVTGDGLVNRPQPRPVVGDGLVNRPQPIVPKGPADTAYEDIYGQPGPTAAQTAQYQAEKGMVTPPAPLADPAGMPRGRPQPTVPTAPAANITGGEYLQAEWIRLKQMETAGSQFPAAVQPPGPVPALIPDQSSPRMDARGLNPLHRVEGPLTPAQQQQQQLGVLDVTKMPSGAPPMRPPSPVLPPFVERIASGMQSVAKGINPAGVAAGMSPVSIPPPQGWGPPPAFDQAADDRMLAGNIAKGIDPAAVTAAIPPAPIPAGWSLPVDMTAQPPPSEAMRLKQPPPAPVFTTTAPPALVPGKVQPAPVKLAPQPVAPPSAATKAAPAPKPVIPEDPKKKKAA